MSLNLKIFLLLPALLFFTSCDNSSNKLLPNTPPDVVNEKIRNIVDPRIDILFVIDNSGSMSGHQSNLIKNISLFVDEIKLLSFLDYRIGVTTSTHYPNVQRTEEGVNGNLIGKPNFVDRNTPNGEQILKTRLNVGINSWTNEYFLDPVKEAFSPNSIATTNAGFYRSDAYLALIFITDAEDQGRTTAQELFDYLVLLKAGRSDKVLSYGAIIPTNSTTSCDRDVHRTPLKIEEFITLTNGLYFDLCDPNYGAQLVGVAKNLASRVASVVRLSRRPDINSIKVTYGSQVIANDPRTGWIYSARTNSINFGPELELTVQPKGTELDIFFVPADL